ncbi:MAG TPA: AarF/UbiB family protein [Virgibacillus sp.]|nr:AarF/UbiB family protein [Virgibacillus sp.]
MGNTLKYNRLYRYIVIVWMTLKFIFQIYLFYIRHRVWDGPTREKWDALLVKQAIEYRKKAVHLGGVLIKVGQFLSTRTDFMPDVFIRELSGLVDKVPAGSFTYAKELMEEEWGNTLDTYLSQISEAPIASASIGEVYHATLRDGSEVAVKVQRKRVQEIFHKDFKALKMVFWLISVLTSFGKQSDLKALYRELIYVMDRELDFEQELSYAKYFRERYEGYRGIRIPDYYDMLCTNKVLVMEWISGAKVTDVAFFESHQIDPKMVAKRLFDFYIDQFLAPGNFHADPHAGNLLVQNDGTVVILDFGMIGVIREQDIQHFKRLVRGLVTEDYDTVLAALEEMDFVLPNADKETLKKVLKQTVDLYKNGTFDIADAHVMNQIKEDIRVFVKDQPIQLSADYAYLGRAISIIYGILISLYPDMDIKEWAQPKIKELLNAKNVAYTIYKEAVKETIRPLISLPQATLDWLKNDSDRLKWDKEKTFLTFKHHFYLLIEGFSFIIGVMGTLFMNTLSDMMTKHMLMMGYTLTGVSFLVLVITLLKHYRWIKKQK